MNEDQKALKEVLDLLDLEPIEVNIFRGRSPQDRSQRVFGGQVLGQALVAAGKTVEERICHSLHAYFLRGGDPKVPILYEVDRSRDGGSFTARRVRAIQHGEPIFTMSASFQNEETGFDHQATMPDAPPPESLVDDRERIEVTENSRNVIKAWAKHARPIEQRTVDFRDSFKPEKQPPYQMTWIKAAGTVPDGVAFQQCLLAYASDMTLLGTSLLPHGVSWATRNVQLASLDHAMWFHRPFDMNEWLLYVQDSPSASGARGFTRGQIYRRDGVLVASVTQEGLIRPREYTKKA